MRDMEIARSIMMSAVNLSHSGILDVFGGGGTARQLENE